ncbi:MAG: DUF3237 domain-containing protein [Myxococcota bacterium]|nr:DUF3237 domain-containing protein [Myxococcota bacterium]
MKLEYLFSYRAGIKMPPTEVGGGPLGNRVIYDVTGGDFEGPELRGRLLASGGDWALFGSDGVGRLDVRATLETDDGARILMQYLGVLEMNDAVAGAVARGEGTDWGDNYFMTQPRFETGDERYAWLNRVVAVAEGRMLPAGVEYKVYQVTND